MASLSATSWQPPGFCSTVESPPESEPLGFPEGREAEADGVQVEADALVGDTLPGPLLTLLLPEPVGPTSMRPCRTTVVS